MTFTLDVIGCDGSVWHLTDPNSPVTVALGVGGMHLPDATLFWSESAGRPGKSFRGSRMLARTFPLPVTVGDLNPPVRTGSDWYDLDGLWWQAWSTDEQSTLIVNGQRKLQVRLDENNAFVFPQDPALQGLGAYTLALVADSPAWTGDDVTTPFIWAPDGGSNYYGGDAGLGPPFVIGAADLFRSARVANPGDLPTRQGRWVFTGPADTVSFGLEGRVNTLPFGLNENDIVIVNIDEETITDPQGNNLWYRMGFTPIVFDPIPPGDSVPIVLGMQNANQGASAELTVTPWFRRAWGASPGATVTGSVDGGLGTGGLGTEGLGE